MLCCSEGFNSGGGRKNNSTKISNQCRSV